MKKSIFAWLLSFLVFVVFHVEASDEEEEEQVSLQAQLPNKVMYMTLFDFEHELYKTNENNKKVWVKGTEKRASKHNIESNEKPSFSVSGLHYPRSIQYIFKYTEFTSDKHPINFIEADHFLTKINSLGTGSYINSYNHLCLSLYVTYLDGEESKVAESPLYAEWVGEIALNDNGDVKKDLTANFYTNKKFPHDGQLAYFTAGPPAYHKKAHEDNEVFPIPSTRCYNKESYTKICEAFYRANTDDNSKIQCDSDKKAPSCGHTEPNALFQVQKNADKLFAPLIKKARGAQNVASIGIRFFSYREPCLHCIAVLHKNKQLKLENSEHTLNIIFNYCRDNDRHIIKIENRSPLKRFTNLHGDGQIFTGVLSNDNEKIEGDGSFGTSSILGSIQVAKEIELKTSNPLLLIYPSIEAENHVKEDKKFTIYITK